MQPAQKKSMSAMSIVSLVLSGIAALTSFLPFINNASFFIALLGIVFAIIGLVSTGKGKKSGKGIAIAGLVLGILSIVIVLVTQSIYAAALEEAFGTGHSSSAPAAEQTQESEVREAGSGAPEPEEDAAAPAYEVSIGEAYTTYDFEGKSVIVVTYNWVNNSDKPASAYITLRDKAFQNGVELEKDFFVEAMDSSGWDSEVKPGSGTTYQQAYELVDDSVVSVEVTELISFNDTILAEGAFEIN